MKQISIPMQKDLRFSVLMSLYLKEKKDDFITCMESLLSQTVLPDEIVLVIDGHLTRELNVAVRKYMDGYPDLIKIVPLAVNQGLGSALAKGIQYCTYELVARMDTDDIARKDRFERQLAEFAKNPELDICGSHIVEFEGDIHNIISRRKVPLDDKAIKKYQKRRDAFNHMTVMYKRSAVLKAGNYQSLSLMEDTLLWVKMILKGSVCQNIDDYLVYARVGHKMYERRGGWQYFLKYREGRKKVKELGYISNTDYYYTLLIQLVVSCVPLKIRGMIFKKILHR